jgi:hypothetical protein
MDRAHYYTKDHPEANGRKPLAGEHAYSLIFPLADGNELEMHCGEETLEKFAEMLGSMMIDDDAESVVPE